MKHELVKKKQLLLSLQNSTRRELRIKFLSHRFVFTQDFASKAQDQKWLSFLLWKEITTPSAFFY